MMHIKGLLDTRLRINQVHLRGFISDSHDLVLVMRTPSDHVHWPRQLDNVFNGATFDVPNLQHIRFECHCAKYVRLYAVPIETCDTDTAPELTIIVEAEKFLDKTGLFFLFLSSRRC